MKFDRVMDFALENDRAQLGGAQQAAATAAASQYPIFMMAMVFITAKEVSQQNENRKSNPSPPLNTCPRHYFVYVSIILRKYVSRRSGSIKEHMRTVLTATSLQSKQSDQAP